MIILIMELFTNNMREESPRGNVPEFSVSELAGSLKRTLEDTYGRVRVRGELSRVTVAASGHMYSSLKDDQAVIDAVCWKATMAKLGIRPEEGLEVICTGRITTYPARSNYQLVIESMELAGQGALLKMLEDRRKKLAAEGLFDEAHKKPIPFLPQVIGVVTSPTGAVIRDILHRLNDRFPRRVIVWPVLVQGAGAAEQVAAAINGFNALDGQGDIPRPDLLIVARGGGSLEDLMPFNEESVVRAVAACRIPIISAVGHETDTTLCDYAADLRAPTPTGAAEMAVPRRMDLLGRVQENAQRLSGAIFRLTDDRKIRLENLSARLGDPARLLEGTAQRLDMLGHRLEGVFDRYLSQKSIRLAEISGRLSHPRNIMERAGIKLQNAAQRLDQVAGIIVPPRREKLGSLARVLESLSFHRILDRGFAVVQRQDGTLVQDPDILNPGEAITIEFKDKKTLRARSEG